MKPAFGGRSQEMADSVTPTRSPPHGAKAVRNQRRKYFRSPLAKRPYTSRMKKRVSKIADGAGRFTSAASVRCTRAIGENDCSPRLRTATPGVMGNGRGDPTPPFFEN